MAALFARLRSRDVGFTIVEVLVAAMLAVIVIGLSSGLVINALRQNSNLTQQTEAQNRNNIGMEQLTRALRQAVLPVNGTSKTASIISAAQPDYLQFTTRLSSTSGASDNAMSTPVVTVKAQFDTATHTLKWGTGTQNTCTAPNICTYATPALNKTLVYGVRNDGGSTACSAHTNGDSAVFHYWYVDATGNLAAWSSPAHTLAEISVVQIDLWTKTQTGPQQPKCVALTDYVQLRNWSS